MLLVLQIKLSVALALVGHESQAQLNLRQVLGCEKQPMSDVSVDYLLSRT